MCAVIPHNLGKGTRWRVPVASPRRMTRIRHRADRVIRIVSPIHHAQGLELSRSTCTEPRRTVVADPAPLGRGLRAPPSPPLANRAPIGCRQRLPAEPRAGRISLSSAPIDRRAFRRPWNHEQDLEPSRSTCTEPWTNGAPFDRRIRLAFRSPQPGYPRRP